VIQKNNFERMLAHAVWGDPIHGLWFIGIEEGSGWTGSPLKQSTSGSENGAVSAVAGMRWEGRRKSPALAQR
jgi:hypothetical protein